MTEDRVDIVDRLRDPAAIVYNEGKIQTVDCMEAAETIERLRGALTRIASKEGFVFFGALDQDNLIHQELRSRIEYAKTALGT